MKKFKFNKNAKLVLATFSIAATSATILAACKKINKDAVNKLLKNQNFQLYLTNSKSESKKQIETELNKALGIEKVDSALISEFKKFLGKEDEQYSNNVNPSKVGQTVFAYYNYFKNKIKEKESIFTEDQLKDLTNIMGNFLNAAKNFDESITDFSTENENNLRVLKANFQANFTRYFDSDKENLDKTKKAMKEDFKKFIEKLREDNSKVKTLSENAFSLEKTIKQLDHYIKTKATKFLEDDNRIAGVILHDLSNDIETILGVQGKDLWNGDNPVEITEKNSTNISKAVALLEKSENADKEINKHLKKLVFEKDLSLSVQNASDLLNSALKNKLPVDSARLKAYLVNPGSNLLDVLKDTINSDKKIDLITKADQIVKWTTYYSEFAGKENSEFVKNLNSAKAKETDENKKAKIEAVIKAFTKQEGIGESFDKFYAKFKKPQTEAQTSVKTYYVLELLSELEQKAKSINPYISETDDLKGVLEVISQATYLRQEVIGPLSYEVSPQKGKTKENLIKNTFDLLDDLSNKISETETDGSLIRAMKELAEVTWDNDEVKSLVQKYAKKENNDFVGDYFTLKKSGVEVSVPNKLSVNNLMSLFIDFQDHEPSTTSTAEAQKKEQPLSKAKKVLDNLSQISQGSQTQIELDKLYDQYKMGDIK